MKKKVIAAILVGTMALSTFAGCNKTTQTSGNGDKITYSVWIGKGEDSQYYSDYADNPVLKRYLTDKYTGADGTEVSVDFEFQIPPTGSERDNLSTLISTGDYTDIVDVDFYSGSITDLYEEGIALDITEYVENYMPNYLAFLEANPDLALTATNVIDGEKKYLGLRSYNTYIDQWQGFEYRRDWIVKYGKNPTTGEVFNGTYMEKNDDGTWNTETWEDDVVFPSGGKHPKYISDWEWMFEIFDIAMEAEGIEDGYSISIPYKGYSEIGFFNAAFGGGTANWYKNPQGNIEFGGDNDNFRSYLQCMNTWYKNGWLDKAYAEHTSALPWRIDEVNVRQGKVGAWVGVDSQFMNKMNIGDASTENIVVFSAAYPMNDIYGEESTKLVEPFSLYQATAESKSFIITDKAKEKDMVALFTFLDTLYDSENAVKNYFGFSKEEFDETKDEYYQKVGLTEGAFYDSGTKTVDGKKLFYFVDELAKDSGNLRGAVSFQRFLGLLGDSSTVAVRTNRSKQLQEMYDIWNETYINTGILSGSFVAQLSAEDAKEFSTIETNVNEFMSRNVPNFIDGTKDPFNNSDWEAYVNAISKYNPPRNVEIYQNLLDTLK